MGGWASRQGQRTAAASALPHPERCTGVGQPVASIELDAGGAARQASQPQHTATGRIKQGTPWNE